MKKGALCISLDFEKFWGMHDVMPLNVLENRLIQVDEVVDRLLDLFEKYEIHATWATVGLLNFPDLESLKSFVKDKHIPYQQPDFSPYPLTKFHIEEYATMAYLGLDSIQKIRTTEGQELASHTFSHYYVLEKGPKIGDFKSDLADFKQMFPEDEITSIVFPRNQVQTSHLEACSHQAYTAYRGNQESLFWKNSDYYSESKWKKIGRFADAYFNLSQTAIYAWDELDKEGGLLNIPASRFFRPHSGYASLEKRKVKRIISELKQAAQSNKIYHLWWHPHNFADQMDAHFEQLETILKVVRSLKKSDEFESLNMHEIQQAYEQI